MYINGEQRELYIDSAQHVECFHFLDRQIQTATVSRILVVWDEDGAPKIEVQTFVA